MSLGPVSLRSRPTPRLCKQDHECISKNNTKKTNRVLIFDLIELKIKKNLFEPDQH